MEFRLEFTPKPLSIQMEHREPVFLIGSCFTENIGQYLKQYKFQVLENPHGIIFNPVSIAETIQSCIDPSSFSDENLFFANECWNSWKHHTRFSNIDKAACWKDIEEEQQLAHEFLKQAGWVIVTLGSSFVYRLDDGSVAANCHKIPVNRFKKEMLDIPSIVALLETMVKQLQSFNSDLKIMFTVSPVRHLRDGFVENNRSKARLLEAVHQVVEHQTRVFYFPAYELVIDDLRDYRFFAEDMVHPNYAATRYVWEKLLQSVIHPASRELMEEINVVNAARQHRPFQPNTEAHRSFLEKHLQKVRSLLERYPYLNLEEERRYFGGE